MYMYVYLYTLNCST